MSADQQTGESYWKTGGSYWQINRLCRQVVSESRGKELGMKLNLKLKRIGTVLVTTILMTAALGKPCTADTGSPVIDPEKTGSLTIYKISENNGNVYEGNGKANEAFANRGIPGAMFEIVKIADISMGADDTNGVSGGFTGLESDFFSLCTDNGVTIEMEGTGSNRHWTTERIMQGFQELLSISTNSASGEDIVRSYVSSKSTKKQLGPTDNTGKAEISGLPLGLYLVAEVSAASGSGSESTQSSGNLSSPFLVSLPMSAGDDNDSNTYWMYDVTVYPKVPNITVPKYIVDDDGETLRETADYEIGETVHQIIAPSIPVVGTGENKGYEKYVVTDEMEKGLSVSEVTSVKLGPWVADPTSTAAFSNFTKLTKGTDYAVFKNDGTDELTSNNASGTKKFRVELLPDGLAKLKGLNQCGQLVVFFDAVVTGEADAGNGSPNVNTPTLTAKQTGGPAVTFTGNSPAVYTYRLNIDKVGVSDYSKVSFSVSRGDTQLQFIKESDGVYHLFDHDTDNVGNAKTAVIPDSGGHLAVKGLDSDTYKITEQSTQSGRELLKSAFEVTLTGKTPVNGELQEARLSVGTMSTTLTIEQGTASMQVQNRSALVLRTGGSGVVLIYIGAIGLFGIALVLTVMKAGRKEK